MVGQIVYVFLHCLQVSIDIAVFIDIRMKNYILGIIKILSPYIILRNLKIMSMVNKNKGW